MFFFGYAAVADAESRERERERERWGVFPLGVWRLASSWLTPHTPTLPYLLLLLVLLHSYYTHSEILRYLDDSHPHPLFSTLSSLLDRSGIK